MGILPEKPRQTPLLSGPVIRASVIGLHCVSGMLVGGGIGYFLRSWFDAAWCFWLFLALGFLAGCLNMYRDVQRLLRDQDAIDAAKKPPRD